MIERIESDLASVLSSVDLSRVRIAEIAGAGPGVAYYSAYHMRSRGDEGRFEDFLTLELQEGMGIWRQHAGRDLLDHLLARERYEEADRLALTLSALFPEDPDLRLHHLAALSRQRRDVEVLTLLDSLEREGPASLLDRDFYRGELQFLRAAALAGVRSDGWTAAFVELFTRPPASELHVRAIDLLLTEGLLGPFDSDERTAIEAVSLHARGLDRDAADLLLAFAASPALLTPQMIRTVGAVYGNVHRPGAGIERLAELERGLTALAALDDRIGFALAETRGFLSRRMGLFGQAAAQFMTAFAAAEALDRDRMRWYAFDSLRRVSAEAAVSDLAELAATWQDPGYFSDTIDQLLTDLVRDRRWDLVSLSWEQIDGSAAAYINARLDFLVASALYHGFLSSPETGVADRERARSLLQGVAAAVPEDYRHRYYVTVAAAALGADPQLFAAAPAENPAETERQEPGGEGTDALLSGFVTYGLPDAGYEKLRLLGRNTGNLRPPTLLRLAGALVEAGRYEASLRAVDAAIRLGSGPLSEADIELAFPRGYAELVEAEAEAFELCRSVVYAVVREESYFNPEARSHVGATGLMQLMPATAADVARTLRLDSPVLTDPAHNVRMGSAYLAWLNRVIENEGRAVLAYNAGPGRIWGWEGTFGDLPDELFFEAVPFRETRDYGRKLLGSTVMYGLLYHGLDPSDIVSRFLPSFVPDFSSTD